MEQQTVPNNLNAEAAVLGTAMLNQEAIPELVASVTPDHFYKPAHQQIAAAIFDLFKAGENVDIITVVEELKERGDLNKVGGEAYIASLLDVIPARSMVKGHSKIIAENAKKRNLIALLSDFAHRCYTAPLEHVVEDFSQKYFRIVAEGKGNGPAPISSVLGAVFDELHRKVESGQHTSGLATGFYEIDKILGGLHPSDLVVLGARPSMGKTTLAMNIALNCSRNGAKVAVFSLEMSSGQLAERLLSTTTGICGDAIRRGILDEQQREKMSQAGKGLSNLPLVIDDNPALSAQAIRAKASLLATKDGLDLIVVDYLQLMRGTGETREREVSEMSAGLKGIAKTLNIPVLVLSQLNRSLESRPNKRPILSDLRDSGSIEQDADVVLFLYRDEVYNRSPDNPLAGIAELIVAKHRNGRTGAMKLRFDGHLYRFMDV